MTHASPPGVTMQCIQTLHKIISSYFSCEIGCTVQLSQLNYSLSGKLDPRCIT